MNLIYFSPLFLILGISEAYFISIDAHAEECFFDKVKSGTKMSLMFEVAEGGFLDIDIKVGLRVRRCGWDGGLLIVCLRTQDPFKVVDQVGEEFTIPVIWLCRFGINIKVDAMV